MKLKESFAEIGIARIKDDSVLLRDSSLLAILEVEPVAYDKMSETAKDKIEKIYKQWLDSLEYPVQISARKVNIDIADQTKVIKNKVEYTIKQKEEYRDILKLFKEFEVWLDDYLAKNASSKTAYYIVIPVFSVGKLIKGFGKVKTSEEYSRALEILNSRVKNSIDLLSSTGVKIKRLDNEGIENLYDSYFETSFYSKGKYYSSLDWIEKWRSSQDASE